MYHPTLIAMDGPAASGKSTVGFALAQALGYLFLDTGCMYRAATLAVLDAGIDIMDESAVTDHVQSLDMNILPLQSQTDGRQYTVLLDGEDVTWQLRTPAVDRNVSQVSKYMGVREEMVRRQREFGERGNVVMVGRDIGTVVLPDAPVKLYVTASAEERARRRWHDRLKQGYDDSFEAILADVERRDDIDSNRAHSPLRPADDAIIVDTSGVSAEDVVAMLISAVEQATPSPTDQP